MKKTILIFFFLNLVAVNLCGTITSKFEKEKLQQDLSSPKISQDESVQKKEDTNSTTNQNDIESKNTKEQGNYSDIYEEFLKTKEWRKVDYFGNPNPVTLNNVKLTSKRIVDIDSDGIPELCYVARDPKHPVSDQIYGFCTIVNNKVKILKSGYHSGGSIGGTWLEFRYDKQTSKHVLLALWSMGGFGGEALDETYYLYEGGEISPIISLYRMSQTKDLYTPKELEDPSLFYIEEHNPYEDFGGQDYITTYKVDEIQTTKEIYTEASKRFTKPQDEMLILE
jgi:hypothetical protein